MAPSSLPCTVPLRYTVICSRSLAWSSVTRAGWPVTAPCSLTCASWSPGAMVHTSTSTWCLLLVGLVGRIVEVGKQRLVVQRPRLGDHLGDPFDVFHRPVQRRRQLQGRGGGGGGGHAGPAGRGRGGGGGGRGGRGGGAGRRRPTPLARASRGGVSPRRGGGRAPTPGRPSSRGAPAVARSTAPPKGPPP